MYGKVKKEPSLIFVVLLTAILLSGCSAHSTIVFQENGSGNYEEAFTISKTLWNELFTEEGSEEAVLTYYRTLYPQADVSISDTASDGKAAKTLHISIDFKNISEYQQIVSAAEICSVSFRPNYYTRSRIYMPLDEDTAAASGIAEELEQLFGSNDEVMQKLAAEVQNMDIAMSITFPYTVTKTNGSIQEDKKTVIWNNKTLTETERLYALFHTSNSKSAPEYTGAANGKSYNTGISLMIDSENLLDRVNVNDETTQSDYLFLSAEGLYRITATDINGNSSSIKFRIDTTKPAVSGVKSGKIYKSARTIRFSDKGSGIKTASLNGQAVKTGKKVSKKGAYTLTVTDKAGNQKTVKFTIK